MPLLRTESRQKEAEISLETTKNGCTPLAKMVVLPLSPDEALVVDVAGGLNGCDVIKPADVVLVKTNKDGQPYRQRATVKVECCWLMITPPKFMGRGADNTTGRAPRSCCHLFSCEVS